MSDNPSDVERFVDYMKRRVRQSIKDRGYSSAADVLKMITAHEILDYARQEGVPMARLEAVEAKIRRSGEWFESYEAARETFEQAESLIDDYFRDHSGMDYRDVLDAFDPIKDAALIANIGYCIPGVKEIVGEKLGNYYRILLTDAFRVRKYGKRKGYKKRKKEKGTGDRDESDIPKSDIRTGLEGNVVKPKLEEIIEALPGEIFDGEKEEDRRLVQLLVKSANRTAYGFFKHYFDIGHDLNLGVEKLEEKIADITNPNIKVVYEMVKEKYKEYCDFEIPDVNPNFRDKNTGEVGVLPALHQLIDVKDALDHKRYGILSGCGTGKTFIAAAASKIAQQSGKHKRTLVLGTQACYRAWKKGLDGDDDERYFTEKQGLVAINGTRKNDALLEKLEGSNWVFCNYEQLNTKFRVNGEDRTVFDVLMELGFDTVNLDEMHNIRNQRIRTKSGRLTDSVAAKRLANHCEYAFPITATPCPDNPHNYRNIYDVLRRVEDGREWEEIVGTHKGMKTNISFDPRNMWFVINYNTVRRTSEDVYDLPGIDESDLYPAIGMKGDQRKLYDHIVTQRKIGWLNQAQKALLDPRMVDPEILKELDLLGKFKIEDSVKYKRLMKYILEKDKGELEAGEKFVVFSSEYAQGVTRENKDLKAVYEKMEEGEEREENEKMKEWKSSELDVTLADYIQKKVADVYGKKIGVIDGQLGLDEKLAVNDMLANDDDCIGVLCTTEAGGESLDYSRASFCYVLDDCFIPEEMDQAISRVDRKGQIHPVKLRYLFVDETLDDQKHAYVNVKRIINSIAMDGEPLTEEEIEILNDTKNTTLTYMIMKSLGGISIDTSQAEIEDTNAFSTKVRRKSKATKAKGRRKSIVYETTDAQKILSRIGRDPGCWFDEDFAVYYTEHLHELSVYPVHSAKVVDLVKRAATGDIEFPGRVLSDGAGPSILYSVYETLENVVSDNGFSVPEIVERDYSENMLILGDNNEQVIGNMTGEDSSFSDGEFDMVDNSSITLLENSEDALKTLKEAHRVTRMGGLLHLRTKGWRFTDGFYKALKKLGYELLSKKNEGFALTAAFKRKLKGSHGDHYAEAYAAQFSGTYRILARKVSDSCEDVDEDVWFEQEIPERTETLVDLITNGQEENVDVDIRPGEPDLESGTRFIVGQDGVVERVVRSEDVEVDEEE